MRNANKPQPYGWRLSAATHGQPPRVSERLDIDESKRRKLSGSALIMATMGLVVLSGMLGLAVDVGWASFRKESAQSAAEAAALAAVKAAWNAAANNNGEFKCGSSGDVTCNTAGYTCPSVNGSGTNLQVGCSYASLNGFVATGSQNVILTSNVGSLGPGNTDCSCTESDPQVLNINTGGTYYSVPAVYWVTARVVESVPQLFSAIIPGHNNMLSGARATAAISQVSLNTVATLLGSGAPGHLPNDLTSSGLFAGIQANSSGIYINGNVSFGALLNYMQASVADISGTCDGQISGCGLFPFVIEGGTVNENTGSTYKDPLITVPPPTVNSCSSTTTLSFSAGSHTVSPASGDCIILSVTGTANVTLNPGEYIGTNITGGTVTYNPGTYIVAAQSATNPSMNIQEGVGLSTNVSGSGVTFYNTSIGSYPVGPIDIQAGIAGASFSAPSTGTLAGMLFFESRTAPAGQGGANFWFSAMNATGNIYFPNSSVTYNISISNDVSIVAQSLALNDAYLYNPYYLPGGPNAPAITLIE